MGCVQFDGRGLNSRDYEHKPCKKKRKCSIFNHGSYKKLKHFFKDFSRTKSIFQGPFVECHVTCLTQ